MSNNHWITSVACIGALMLAGAPILAQRPAQGEPQRPAQEPPAPPPPPAARPQQPPPPPPSDPNARAQQEQQRIERARAQQEQQRIENARAQQEQQRVENARAQQEQQRVENARAQQEQKRIENARQQQESERVARARQSAAAASAASATPANREIISQLIAAEHVHRDQLARINRLKQIAERQGRRDRVGELDQLLINANTNFDSTLQRAKGKLTDAEYTNTVAMLEQGRRREVQSLMGGGGGAEPADATRERASAPSRTATPTRPPH